LLCSPCSSCSTPPAPIALLPLLQLLHSLQKNRKNGKEHLCPNIMNIPTLFIKTSHPSTKFKITKGRQTKKIKLMSLNENEENQNRGQTKMKKTFHPYTKLKTDKKENTCPYVKITKFNMGDKQK
jgi:hypothetical protein